MKRLLAALLLSAAPAHAQFISGNEWLNRYRSTEPIQRVSALSYVTGVLDGSLLVCVPPGVTVGQVSDMTARAIVEVAHLRHHSASTFVIAVAGAVWPCKNEERL